MEVSIGERIAVLETQMENTLERLKTIETAVDELKSTVWKATGAVCALIAIVELLFKLIGSH